MITAQNCLCPKNKCTRHGECDECTHPQKGKLPYYKRPKTSLFGFLRKKKHAQ